MFYESINGCISASTVVLSASDIFWYLFDPCAVMCGHAVRIEFVFPSVGRVRFGV